MQRLMVLASFVCFISVFSHAQGSWVPYSAHFSDTVTIQGEAPSVVEGVRYRNSGGDVANSNFANGSQKVVKGGIYLASEGIHYDINPDKRQALGVHQHLGKLNITDKVLGHEIVENYPTTVYPIRGRHNEISGKIWVINGTDVIIRTHVVTPNGTNDFQLSNVKLYQDPDKSLFAIPVGYEISKPQ